MTEKKELKPWVYRGVDVAPSTVPEEAIGFIYLILWDADKPYIGKKSLTSSRKKAIGVREKATTGTRKRSKIVVKDSGWQTYTGSCKPLNELITQEPKKCYREILEWAYSKKNLHYLEMKYQYKYNVLETDSFNDNIGGRIWRMDADKKVYDKYKEEQKNKPKKPKVKKDIPY